MADLARSQSQWNELHCWITVHHWFCHLLLHGKKKKKKREKKAPVYVCWNLLICHVCSRQLSHTTQSWHDMLWVSLVGCVGAGEGYVYIRVPEKTNVCVCVCVCVCVSACGREEKQSLQSSHFCLMKNGRLAFRDVVMCRILMCAHQTASHHFKNEWHRSEALIDQPCGRSNSWGNLSSLNLQMGHKEFLRRTSCSLTRRKSGPRDTMFGCFRKDSQSQQIVQ